MNPNLGEMKVFDQLSHLKYKAFKLMAIARAKAICFFTHI